MSLVREVGHWIAGAAAFLGPWGVFVVALADSALVPLPQGVDALLLAQAIATPELAYLAAGLGTLGSVIGSAALYYVGKRAGRAVLARNVSPAGIARLSDLVGKWGAALLIPVTMTPLPLPMKPVVLASGIFQMPLVSFCLAIGVSRMIRYFGVVFLALRFGDEALGFATDNLHLVLLGCAAIVSLFIWAHRASGRWLNRES